MQAVVTKVAGFRGKLAVEYEIRLAPPQQTTLAYDYVVITPAPGETWEAIRDGILAQFLSIAAAKWELSDAAKRLSRKEARIGQRLDSTDAPPVKVNGRLPSITIDSGQAEDLRFPLIKEKIDGVETGRMVRSTVPRFTV